MIANCIIGCPFGGNYGSPSLTTVNEALGEHPMILCHFITSNIVVNTVDGG